MTRQRKYYDIEMIGANFRAARKNAGLSVAEVKEFLGFESTQSIYKWESGTCLPQADTLIEVADLYGIDPRELFAEPDEREE